MNKLEEGDFEVTKWDKKSQHGVFCEMEVRGQLLSALSTKTRLRAPSCSIMLEKRIRQQMTEEEYLAAHPDEPDE